MYKVRVIEALPSWINQIFLFFKRHKLKYLSALFDYRNLIVVYPWLMRILSRKIKKRKPDQIQISSFAIAKNIDPLPGIPMYLYLHSPMQYIWSHYEEYRNKFTGRKRKLFDRLVPRLRSWDLKYKHFDSIVCNSHYTQQLAKELYGLESRVQYPKIADEYWYAGIARSPKPYFVCVGRLVNFVRECELIIRLFNYFRLPLLMI